jgi:hypothetical protein
MVCSLGSHYHPRQQLNLALDGHHLAKYMTPNQLVGAGDGFEAVDLLEYAIGHRRAAELLFAADFRLFDSAAYLAHLAMVTLLKACLLECLGKFPKSQLCVLLIMSHVFSKFCRS